MSPFLKALIITAGSITVVSVVSTTGIRIPGRGDNFIFWEVAAGIWVGAILLGIALIIAKKKSAAAGVFVGVAIGLVSIFATCFANILMSI